MISKKQIIAAITAYGISRSVIDDIKPAEGSEESNIDEAVFKEVMTSLSNKEKGN